MYLKSSPKNRLSIINSEENNLYNVTGEQHDLPLIQMLGKVLFFLFIAPVIYLFLISTTVHHPTGNFLSVTMRRGVFT